MPVFVLGVVSVVSVTSGSCSEETKPPADPAGGVEWFGVTGEELVELRGLEPLTF